MLKIHKPFSKNKLLLISITSICITSSLLGISILTYTPELSHAETVTSKKTLGDIEYMQEVTADICTNTPEADTEGNYQYQLKDSRDQKTYWVAKLKDGNCWMTQNLDLDLYNAATGKGITLTEEDSDLDHTWTYTGSPSKIDFKYSDQDGAYYDAGEYVQTRPTATSFVNNSACVSTTNLSECTAWGWKDVTGWQALADSNFTDVIDSGNRAYDSHYLNGNNYNWPAATAGTGTASLTSGDAPSSICPKGWKLPKYKEVDNIQQDGYGKLLTSYGIKQENNAFLFGSQDIRIRPIYMFFSSMIDGRYDDDVKHLRGSHSTCWWTSTTYGDSSPYGSNAPNITLYSNGATYLSLSGGISTHNRYNYGFSVRCVATSSLNQNISIDIPPAISLDAVKVVELTTEPGQLTNGTVSASVKSNQNYSIGLKTQSGKTALSSTTTTTTIPASTTVKTGRNGWGIKKKLSATDSTKLGDDTDSSTYSELTATSTIFYQSAGAEIKDLFFTVGIGTAPNLPSGEYSTDITITATQN